MGFHKSRVDYYLGSNIRGVPHERGGFYFLGAEGALATLEFGRARKKIRKKQSKTHFGFPPEPKF